jgi:hypothetical protein
MRKINKNPLHEWSLNIVYVRILFIMIKPYLQSALLIARVSTVSITF